MKARMFPTLSRRSWTSLTRTPSSIVLHALNNTSFPYIWLKDSCQSPQSINPTTGHKLHCTSDIPLSIAPKDSTEDSVRITETGLEIAWNDGTKSVFNKSWLETFSSPALKHKFHWDDTFSDIQHWSASSSSTLLTGFAYKSILADDRDLLSALEHLAKHGIVFIRGVPTEETSDERCELKKLAERIGEMRKTFYGLVWDVVKLKEGKNVAFTNLALKLHMDLLYFEHPPRYQILHCLRNKAIGGTSLAVDGIYAAHRLRQSHPSSFHTLTKTPVCFHYIHEGHHIHQYRPTIALSPSDNETILHVNYSPPEQGPLPLSTTPPEFYQALKDLTDLFKDERYVFTYDLAEGDAVIFDNRRLVHGRTAFRYMTDEERRKTGRSTEEDGQPDRWLKGCYLGADAVLDRVRVLKTRFGTGKPWLEYTSI